jgi:putative redox protein
MQIKLKRVNEAYHFRAENESGATLDMDATPDIGGVNAGLRPMQVLASSLAGCSSIDILNILYKQKQEIEDYSVEVNAERADAVPAVFTKIHLSITIKGKVDEDKARRAAQLSFEKYCSVSKMLEPTCQITYDVKVL